MATLDLPELIQDFNMYLDGNRLFGITSTVNLPDLEAMTQTISGTGILGEYEAAALGHFGAMEQEIPFRVINDDYFKLIDPIGSLNLTLRGAIQLEDKTVMAKGGVGMRIVYRGHVKKIALNRAEQRNFMEATIAFDATYYMVELAGVQRIELDKLNSIYRVNGTDVLAYMRTLI